jgi:hypothetical protein
MKAPLLSSFVVFAALLCGCTYEGIRMHERSRCAAMPQSQAERCYQRTRMSRGEYDAEREKLRRSMESDRPRRDEELDPRYEKWIP